MCHLSYVLKKWPYSTGGNKCNFAVNYHQYLTNVLSHNLNHGQTIQHSTETEFVQISVTFNMGIIFLTSNLMEAARGQKHPSFAKNGTKESIY